ncbi:putative F-box protein at1g71320 [Phtheirospermum japonicum]|uniref:Putative F-box protein at1g71320 n=1 Tax=Phtheirospermum japonicum TaxID=374723 RepID=A0A830C2S3_9LAMI|nr:putative F-box protein at1g71320 [Phtheirospermum japonicum]
MLKPTNIESLPDEIIFEILVRVPAQDIYTATRLVCRKWYKVIHTHHFIHAHLQQSTPGLLAQRTGQKTFIARGKYLIETSKFNYDFEYRREVMSSCNGLVLKTHDDYRDLYITNPATRQHFALPTILTIGVDKDWTRRVSTRHLSLTAKNLFLSQHPLTTEGFMHWTKNDSRSEYVLTLNVETEIITQFPVPRHGETELMYYYYLPMGSYLSLLIARSKLSWEVWEMKPETGEWTKMPNIDLEAQFAGSLNSALIPVGWLKCREVLVFGVGMGTSRISWSSIPTWDCIACNVRTGEFVKFPLYGSLNRFLVHRNSLVWMDVY